MNKSTAVIGDRPRQIVHRAASIPLQAPSWINYLAVRLKAGETWHYEPPADHTICWVALASGRLAAPEPAEAGELVVFEESNQAINLRAEADSEFVLGSALSHPYDLVLGHYSVHTSATSLRAGETGVRPPAHNASTEGTEPCHPTIEN
jgi:hypothetical protein